MAVIAELYDDLKFVLDYRKRVMKTQKALDAKAPRAGDTAPDFTLLDVAGKNSVTLSGFRGVKPVALVFGSFT